MPFAAQLVKAKTHLSANDPVLAGVIKIYGLVELKPHGNHYKQLLGSIIGQQLSVKVASSIRARVFDHFGGNPTPQQLLSADSDALRGLGLSRAKVSYVKDLAEHIASKRLDMSQVSTLPDEELTQQLVAVKGLGQWSAQMFMIFGLGRLNVLPVGDLGIRRAAMNLYSLRQLPDPETLSKLSKHGYWEPYNSVAALYLWKSLDNAPDLTG